MVTQTGFDVVVVGGGAAGLSGALALARSRRSVLVVDSGEPRNARAGGVHNFLTRDGLPPGELLGLGRAEVAGYGGQFRDGEAVSAEVVPIDGEDGFAVTLADGDVVTARRLLVTTGLVDELPEIPGLAERWGRDVIHCPYCHGWEFRDQRIGVLGSAATGHQAPLFAQLSDQVVILANGFEPLDVPGIPVIAGQVAALVIEGDRLTGARLEQGPVVPLDALVVSPRFHVRAGLLASLGLKPVEGQFGDSIPSGLAGATEIPGVWVAGNVTDPMMQVVGAAAAGLMAGARINADLIFTGSASGSQDRASTAE